MKRNGQKICGTRTLENAATEDPYSETHGIKVQTRYRYDNGNDPANSNGKYTITLNPYRAATSNLAANEPTLMADIVTKIKQFFGQGEYEKAIALIEEIGAVAANNPIVLVWKSRCLQLLNNDVPDDVLEQVENCLKQAL